VVPRFEHHHAAHARKAFLPQRSSNRVRQSGDNLGGALGQFFLNASFPCLSFLSGFSVVLADNRSDQILEAAVWVDMRIDRLFHSCSLYLEVDWDALPMAYSKLSLHKLG